MIEKNLDLCRCAQHDTIHVSLSNSKDLYAKIQNSSLRSELT